MLKVNNVATEIGDCESSDWVTYTGCYQVSGTEYPTQGEADGSKGSYD